MVIDRFYRITKHGQEWCFMLHSPHPGWIETYGGSMRSAHWNPTLWCTWTPTCWVDAGWGDDTWDSNSYTEFPTVAEVEFHRVDYHLRELWLINHCFSSNASTITVNQQIYNLPIFHHLIKQPTITQPWINHYTNHFRKPRYHSSHGFTEFQTLSLRGACRYLSCKGRDDSVGRSRNWPERL